MLFRECGSNGHGDRHGNNHSGSNHVAIADYSVADSEHYSQSFSVQCT